MLLSPAAQQGLSVVSAVVVAVCLWIGLLYLAALVTGWRKLARRFRAQQEPLGECHTIGPFITVYMHMWTRYSWVVRLTAAEDALYMSVVLPFRPCHPPLRIPWDEINFGKKRRYSFLRFIELRLGNKDRVPMRLSPRLADKLDLLKRLPKD